MWRCFYGYIPAKKRIEVCSTHVEMFPPFHVCTALQKGLLHACGDVSTYIDRTILRSKFAPRMWRCFLEAGSRDTRCRFAPRMWRCFLFSVSTLFLTIVCSTHVEMFHTPVWPCGAWVSLLHACGDVSYIRTVVDEYFKFAPRMWRCFLISFECLASHLVCSTHVEMFPASRSSSASGRRLLHACGDVSSPRYPGGHRKQFAPRMWRCFRPAYSQRKA